MCRLLAVSVGYNYVHCLPWSRYMMRKYPGTMSKFLNQRLRDDALCRGRSTLHLHILFIAFSGWFFLGWLFLLSRCLLLGGLLLSVISLSCFLLVSGLIRTWRWRKQTGQVSPLIFLGNIWVIESMGPSFHLYSTSDFRVFINDDIILNF